MIDLAGRGVAQPQNVMSGGRRGLIAVVVVVTSVGGFLIAAFFPVHGAEGGTYEALSRVRDWLWPFLMVAAINMSLHQAALGLAGWLLVADRGRRWATSGGALMGLGGAVYAAGVASWADFYTFVTDPALLDPSVATSFIDKADSELGVIFGPVIVGGVLVGVGLIALSIGLWRAGSVPRCVPVVAAASMIGTFIVGPAGPLGLSVEALLAAASIAVGWYAWRWQGGSPSASGRLVGPQQERPA